MDEHTVDCEPDHVRKPFQPVFVFPRHIDRRQRRAGFIDQFPAQVAPYAPSRRREYEERRCRDRRRKPVCARKPEPGRSSRKLRNDRCDEWKNQAAFGSAGNALAEPRPRANEEGAFQNPKPQVPGMSGDPAFARRLSSTGGDQGYAGRFSPV
jgi:hypothetical protein